MEEPASPPARKGELPEHLWCELYFQSVHDATVAPAGQHTMSVFAQYVPYTFAARRMGRPSRARSASSPSIPSRRFCSNMTRRGARQRRCWARRISKRKSASPAATSSRASACRATCGSHRFAARTPMPGVYLCGACTHPGGSVIGINGRNAAMARAQGPRKEIAFCTYKSSGMLRPT